MPGQKEFTLSRRAFLASPAVASLLAAVGVAAEDPVTALITEQFGPGPILWERVRITPTPLKPETGVFVRLTVAVDHPMEPDNYIKSIAIFVDKNPSPFTVRYNFTPKSGKAEVENVIKMVGNSPIRVIAATNKGQLFGLIQNAEIAGGTSCAG